MRVFVAVHAFLELQWFLEIAIRVALRAIDGNVFSQERELGLGVIKLFVD